jgi:hypothetical protein
MCAYVFVGLLTCGTWDAPFFPEPPPTIEETMEEAQGLRDVQLKPRWPLGAKDPRGIQNVKAMKQARQFPSLTSISGTAS